MRLLRLVRLGQPRSVGLNRNLVMVALVEFLKYRFWEYCHIHSVNITVSKTGLGWGKSMYESTNMKYIQNRNIIEKKISWKLKSHTPSNIPWDLSSNFFEDICPQWWRQLSSPVRMIVFHPTCISIFIHKWIKIYHNLVWEQLSLRLRTTQDEDMHLYYFIIY